MITTYRLTLTAEEARTVVAALRTPETEPARARIMEQINREDGRTAAQAAATSRPAPRRFVDYCPEYPYLAEEKYR